MVLKMKKGPGDGFSFSSWLEDRYLLGISAVRDLIKPPSAETLNQRLSYAVFTDEVLSAKRALRQGADPNGGYSAEYKTIHKGVPHILVAAECASPRMLSLLIDEGASVDKTSADGETALQVAASMQRGEHVKILLERGADVNHVARIPGTALDAYDKSVFRAKYGDNSKVRDALNKAGAKKKSDLDAITLDVLFVIADAGPFLDGVEETLRGLGKGGIADRQAKLQQDTGLEIAHEINREPLSGLQDGTDAARVRAEYEPVTLARLEVFRESLAALPDGALKEGLAQNVVAKLPAPAASPAAATRTAAPAPKS